MELNKVYNADCAEFMTTVMDESSVDLTVTSPPYDQIRDYKGYKFDFAKTANGLLRVTKKGGVVVWVVGDQTINGGESGTSFRHALYFMGIGFTLHDTMIYEKANFSMPQKNRYHQIFEYMFVFSKGKPKTFNPIIDRKNVWVGYTNLGQNSVRLQDGSMHALKHGKPIGEFGKRFNIWRMNTIGQENMCKKNPHPAMFPSALARDHIISWSNEGDTVFDPFLGSGTTAIEAKKLKRNYIGVDISKEYCEMAEKRILEKC